MYGRAAVLEQSPHDPEVQIMFSVLNQVSQGVASLLLVMRKAIVKNGYLDVLPGTKQTRIAQKVDPTFARYNASIVK